MQSSKSIAPHRRRGEAGAVSRAQRKTAALADRSDLIGGGQPPARRAAHMSDRCRTRRQWKSEVEIRSGSEVEIGSGTQEKRHAA
jgi:hypothetical protein